MKQRRYGFQMNTDLDEIGKLMSNSNQDDSLGWWYDQLHEKKPKPPPLSKEEIDSLRKQYLKK